MKPKDFTIITLGPLGVLLIPLVAMQFTREVNWTPADFLVMWVLLSVPTLLFRLLVTRPQVDLAYKLGAGLAVVAGFLMTWVSLAAQIIGDHNPANLFYLGVGLIGLAGVGLSKFRAAALARTAFTAAGAIFLIPVIALLVWPADFQPGVLPVFVGNSILAGLFALSGLLFRHSAGKNQPSAGGALPA